MHRTIQRGGRPFAVVFALHQDLPIVMGGGSSVDEWVTKGSGGTRFELGGESITIKAFGKDTQGRYVLMQWVSSPGMNAAAHVNEGI